MEKQIDQSTFRALVEAAVPILSQYSIGFALPTPTNTEPDATSGGSGTLVTIDDVDGILTARHVVSTLKQHANIGLIFGSTRRELHNISFKTELSRDYLFSAHGAPNEGPDLGFIVPPPNAVADIKARMSFYNLSKRRSAMLESPQSVDQGFWILSGIVDERTEDGSPEGGFSRVKIFRGMHGAGNVTREFDSGKFDYLIFEALYNEFYEGPDSYGGVSGGGLWQLLLTSKNEELVIKDALLAGVAFYQSAKVEDDRGTVREITCHGRRGYGHLIDRVRTSVG